MMQDGGQDGRRNHDIENLLSDKYSINLLHITNVLCLNVFTLFCSQYKLEFRLVLTQQ